MGVFGYLWKRMTSGAESALDDAEAVLAERQKELAEGEDGIVLPSTEVEDPDWLKGVKDAESTHRKRRMPQTSPPSEQDESLPEVPAGPTAEDRARERLARLKQEMRDAEE